MKLPGFVRAGLLFAIASCLAPDAGAQSITAGMLTGSVVNEAGTPIPDVAITLLRDGAVVRTLAADRAGRFSLLLLEPGRYQVLSEQVGYQPLRLTDVVATAGHETRLTVRLTVQPPPVTTVAERRAVDDNFDVSARAIRDNTLNAFGRFRDLTDVLRGETEIDPVRDHGRGSLTSANGLPPGYTRLLVDGIEERQLHNPLHASDAAPTAAFARNTLSGIRLSTFELNPQYRSALGANVSAQSAQARTGFVPFATLSSSALGGASIDNPADSTGTSLDAGFSFGRVVRPDTAAWGVHFNIQRLAQPAASAFADHLDQPAADALRAGAGRNIDPWLSPVVRRTNTVGGGGRIDWRFGMSKLAVRADVASMNADAPILAGELSNAAGTSVDGTDISIGAGFSTVSRSWRNDLHAGFSSARREWLGAGLAQARIADGFSVGDEPFRSGDFREAAFEVSDAISFDLDRHTATLGGYAQRRTSTRDRSTIADTRFDFGSVADYAAERGLYTEFAHGGTAEDIGVTRFSIFAEDRWQASSNIAVTVGVEFDRQRIPKNVIGTDSAWTRVSGISTDIMPVSKPIIAPRAAITWHPGRINRTAVRLAAGLVPGEHDASTFADVAASDDGITVRRAGGDVGWPTAPSDLEARPLIWMYGPAVRRPRSFKADGSISHQFDAGTMLSVRGEYRHADYLLQQTDLNLPTSAASTLTDGRATHGALVQYGALIAPTVGSNRRFDEFDAVFAMTSTGYVDYYAATIAFERQLGRGIGVFMSYTWSEATDNVPGQWSADPYDRLSPFAGDTAAGAWNVGPSDLDVTHRLSATVEYATDGKLPLALAARFRYRSGLPFTPGYRGVDANGDGSFRNDPAFLAPGISGVTDLLGSHSCLASQSGQLVARNSCREDAVQSLDLHASLGLRMFTARRLALTLDLFNLVSTESGVIDHAALRADPLGTITTDNTGRIALPLVANSRFGTILSRRTDPRTLRIGVRLEN